MNLSGKPLLYAALGCIATIHALEVSAEPLGKHSGESMAPPIDAEVNPSEGQSLTHKNLLAAIHEVPAGKLNLTGDRTQDLSLSVSSPVSKSAGDSLGRGSVTGVESPLGLEPANGWEADEVRIETLPEPGTLLLMLLGLLGLGLARRRTANNA